MTNSLKYMPTFRARQQEIIVLKSFDFTPNMYPLIEIIKERTGQIINNRLKKFMMT